MKATRIQQDLSKIFLRESREVVTPQLHYGIALHMFCTGQREHIIMTGSTQESILLLQTWLGTWSLSSGPTSLLQLIHAQTFHGLHPHWVAFPPG